MLTNINFLNCLRYCDTNLRNCVFEWVKIADDVVNLLNLLFREIFLIGRYVASQDTSLYDFQHASTVKGAGTLRELLDEVSLHGLPASQGPL